MGVEKASTSTSPLISQHDMARRKWGIGFPTNRRSASRTRSRKSAIEPDRKISRLLVAMLVCSVLIAGRE
jgi:hypothetical protein